MNINNNTKFSGEDLGKYSKRFEHCLNKTGNSKFKHIWFNEDSGVLNFITNLEDGNEVAGTIIESNGWAESIYIATICEEGTTEI